jgi:alkane 1-monooxygenase
VKYIQHYGLERRRLAGGGFEPVGTRHAWCQTLWLDDLLLLNLPRHAEHHVHPQIPFERLGVPPDAPRYPYSYAVMILLALAPPLFRRVVDPCLDRMGATEAAWRPATS